MELGISLTEKLVCAVVKVVGSSVDSEILGLTVDVSKLVDSVGTEVSEVTCGVVDSLVVCVDEEVVKENDVDGEAVCEMVAVLVCSDIVGVSVLVGMEEETVVGSMVDQVTVELLGIIGLEELLSVKVGVG